MEGYQRGLPGGNYTSIASLRITNTIGLVPNGCVWEGRQVVRKGMVPETGKDLDVKTIMMLTQESYAWICGLRAKA